MEFYAELAIELLKALIPIRAYSFEEKARADFLMDWLAGEGVEAFRIGNNIWAKATFSKEAPTLMLCAHIDTVQAAESPSSLSTKKKKRTKAVSTKRL